MGLFVNTNVASLIARNTLFDASEVLTVSYERLSSGLRVNRAADDAAGLQVLVRMESQVQGLKQGVRNANDGIGLVQVAEGALQETTTALQRIRQLAVQAQSGINSSSDKAALQQEVTALVSEISRIGSQTRFADNAILDGSYSATFQVGANAGQSLSVNLSRTGGFGASGLNVGSVDVTTIGGASAAITSVDNAISAIGQERAQLGASQNRFQSTIRNLTNIQANVASARSYIEDADFAKETSELTRNQIIQQATIAVLQQANQTGQTALSLLG
ncbi:MAG: flagellin FliC [Alteromonadaceae bacterium]|nr:flagellin FliC [Alteromonadaceae bacterium]